MKLVILMLFRGIKMTNIDRIKKDLMEGLYSSNPAACANDKAILAGEYATLCGLLEDNLSKRAAVWNEMRKNFKSDTACSRAYEQTDAGRDEMALRLRMKSIEKMSAALTALLKVAEGEKLNQW
jgi:hypothetical protein